MSIYINYNWYNITLYANLPRNGLVRLARSWSGNRQDQETLVYKIYCKEKGASIWKEGLSSILEGEWTGGESQRGLTQGIKRMTARQTKEMQLNLSGNVFIFS